MHVLSQFPYDPDSWVMVSHNVTKSHGKQKTEIMADNVLGLQVPYEEAFSIYVHGLDLSSGGTYADIDNTSTPAWKKWMASNPKHFNFGENIILWQCTS